MFYQMIKHRVKPERSFMFQLGNLHGRAVLIRDARSFDLASITGDETLASPLVAVARHEELHAINDRLNDAEGAHFNPADLAAPIPQPRQVFAIGLNYLDHAAESQMEPPPAPLTFAKFPSCIASPNATVELSGSFVDWEAELVVVIGQECRHVSEETAWSVVAGLSVGQDISDRVVQFTGAPPQFGLGKSFETYGPFGPTIVSIDAVPNPDDLALSCSVNGETMQNARTSEMIFSVPQQIAYLSSICRLFPGDVIFTGTPSGIGASRGQFLKDGDLIVSSIEGIGEIQNRCVVA